jgi:hypothetical protein
MKLTFLVLIITIFCTNVLKANDFPDVLQINSEQLKDFKVTRVGRHFDIELTIKPDDRKIIFSKIKISSLFEINSMDFRHNQVLTELQSIKMNEITPGYFGSGVNPSFFCQKTVLRYYKYNNSISFNKVTISCPENFIKTKD